MTLPDDKVMGKENKRKYNRWKKMVRKNLGKGKAGVTGFLEKKKEKRKNLFGGEE